MARPRKTPRTLTHLPAPTPLTESEVLNNHAESPGYQVFMSHAEEYLRLDIRLDRRALTELTKPVAIATSQDWLGMIVLFSMLFGRDHVVPAVEEKTLIQHISFTRNGAERVIGFLQSAPSVEERSNAAQKSGSDPVGKPSKAAALRGRARPALENHPELREALGDSSGPTDVPLAVHRAGDSSAGPAESPGSAGADLEHSEGPARGSEPADSAERERRRQRFRELARQNNLI